MRAGLLQSSTVVGRNDVAAWTGLVGIEDSRLDVFRTRISMIGLSAPLCLEASKFVVRGGGWFWIGVLCVAGVWLQLRWKWRYAGWSCAAAAVGLTAITFPTTANHMFALAMGWLALAVAAQVESMRGRLNKVPRWLCLSILFWSGAQKLLHETYWHGEFLAAKLVSGEARWQWLRHLLETGEQTALFQAKKDGPFLVHSAPFLIVSRAIPFAEMGLGVGLLVKRLRMATAAVACAFVVGLQSFAGEMVFALTMLALLSTFLPLRIALSVARVCWVWALIVGGVFVWNRSVWN